MANSVFEALKILIKKTDMFINLTNHSSGKWNDKQKLTAEKLYGTIVDMSFPYIDPTATSLQIEKLAKKLFQKILESFHPANNETNAVHIQGEFTFVVYLVSLLLDAGIECVASTTKREVEEKDGRKIASFNFVQFRKYRKP